MNPKQFNQTCDLVTQINKLKTLPVNYMVLGRIPAKEIIKGVQFWLNADIQIDKHVFNETKNVWDATTINLKKSINNIGFLNPDTIVSLINSNVVYADGTFNEEFINHVLCLSEIKGKKIH